MKKNLGTGRRSEQCRTGAFTLIELILVMALIVMTVAIVLPKLKMFFSGRNVDSEVRHFQAMMHYGQSRAATEGIPTMLWIDPAAGKYGLEQEPGYNDKDVKAVENSVVAGVTIGISREGVKTPLANSQTGRILIGQAGQKARRDAIYFSPDGGVNTNRSVTSVSFQSANNATAWVSSADGKVSYATRR